MTAQTSLTDGKDTTSAPATEVADEAAIWAEMDAKDTSGNEAPLDEGRELIVDTEPAVKDDNVEPDNKGEPAATEAAKVEPAVVDLDPQTWQDPEKARQAYEALAQKVKSDTGRQAALQRRVAELQREIKAVGTTATDDPRKHLESIREEYPEVAGPVSQAVEALASRVEQIDQREQGRSQAAQQELDQILGEQTRLVDEAVPGWKDVINKNAPTFKQWIDDQPLRMRNAYVRNYVAIEDAAATIEIVEAFKNHLNPPAQSAAQTQPLNDRRQRQLAGSSSPNRSSRATVVSGIPEDGDPQAIWDAFEAQDQARARR